MVYVKWVFRAVVLLLLAAFLHYTLPQTDIVRITDTYEKRVDPGRNALFWSGADAGSNQNLSTRDVFFIQTFLADDSPMIYRNEDTGWGWPPYFKFDTANLQARASDLISKKSAQKAQWVAVRHYGWRIPLFSIYPNAVKLWAVDGPDVRIIPWFNIVFLVLLVAVARALQVRWRRFRQRRIDPVVDDWTDGWG